MKLTPNEAKVAQKLSVKVNPEGSQSLARRGKHHDKTVDSRSFSRIEIVGSIRNCHFCPYFDIEHFSQRHNAPLTMLRLIQNYFLKMEIPFF